MFGDGFGLIGQYAQSKRAACNAMLGKRQGGESQSTHQAVHQVQVGQTAGVLRIGIHQDLEGLRHFLLLGFCGAQVQTGIQQTYTLPPRTCSR